MFSWANTNYPYEVPATLEMAVVILAASSFQIRDFVNMIVYLDFLKSHDEASSLSVEFPGKGAYPHQRVNKCLGG